MGYQTRLERDKTTGLFRRIMVQGERALKFTPQLILQEMMQAHAYMNLRTACADQDFEFILNLLKFTNPATPGVI
jgi:hypothetical protein